MDPPKHDDDLKIPEHPEQDQDGGDDLPTYDDLTVQQPNSRFGRWRSWIGKRAAERYDEESLAVRAQRRARGWDLEPNPPIVIDGPEADYAHDVFTDPHDPRQLRLVTDLNEVPPPLPPKDWEQGDSSGLPDYSDDPSRPILSAQPITPSHLLLNHFGSRFIPHTKDPIRCLLPLPAERLLLIGTDDGLSVLNLFPAEWSDNGLIQKGPHDAQARVIWTGEAVLQMTLLECESIGEHGMTGVVLVLTAGDCLSPRETESTRAIRMYNLASLISLAKWAISDRMTQPLDLRRPSSWQQQETPKKKHGRHASLAKGLKSLILESPIVERVPHSFNARSAPLDQTASRTPPPTRSNDKTFSPGSSRLRLERDDSNDSAASWDVIDDLPLRWATDYVPLASPGSRLSSMSVLAYDLRLSDDIQSRGGALLAVTTKTAILLYETPKGERAFKFSKEFYTPLHPRGVTFVQQHVQYMTGISSNDISRVPRPAHPRHLSESNLAQHLYPPQLCIFVIFEKKAGIIRIADSAVGEIELFSGTDKDTMGLPQSSSSKESMSRLSPNPNTSISGSFVNRHRSHSVGNARRDKGNWIHPTQIEVPPPPSANDHLPTPGSPGSTPVYLLTRGRITHVLPYPLPAIIDAKPPLYVITWTASPSHVAVRLNHTSYELGAMPFIQLIAFTEDGLEIQEFDRETITGHASGKGKARVTEPIRAQADVGGEVGFLCEGGHWQRAQNTRLARAFSVSSDASGTSFESLDSVQADAKLAMEQGIYGWVCKGLEDWRVLWVGGTGKEDLDDET